MEGVVRTRVGYAGGVADSPTYQRIGDHSEAVQIDYDPTVVTYDDLLAAFFSGHDTGARPFSTQYRSAIFYSTDSEGAAAERARARAEAGRGRLHTSIEPQTRFWIAEGYHQKFRLRSHKEVFADLLRNFPDEWSLVGSTSAARVNGWLDGCEHTEMLERELPLTGLSQDSQSEVRAYALRPPRAVTR
jgi:peptide-methionine (S)-S-oxide reductase